MKLLLGTIFLLFSMNVMAMSEDGLECTMTYKSASPFQALRYTQTHWVGKNTQIKGNAVSEEFGDKSAHLVLIKKVDAGEGNMDWQILVYDANNNYLGLSRIPEKGTMKVTYPTEAWATDSEDPESFNLLEVSCHYTIFAG